MTHCWLARFSDVPCDGDLVRCHLIPKQQLKKSSTAALNWDGTLRELIDDERVWVPGCGGPTGLGGHHGMLDHSRTLRIPYEALPADLVELAKQLGLGWYLEREYKREYRTTWGRVLR